MIYLLIFDIIFKTKFKSTDKKNVFCIPNPLKWRVFNLQETVLLTNMNIQDKNVLPELMS